MASRGPRPGRPGSRLQVRESNSARLGCGGPRAGPGPGDPAADCEADSARTRDFAGLSQTGFASAMNPCRAHDSPDSHVTLQAVASS